MSRDRRVALPHGATGLSAVCDCGISGSYSLTIFYLKNILVYMKKDKKFAYITFDIIPCADPGFFFRGKGVQD